MNPVPLRSDSITSNWSQSREQELSKLKQEASIQAKEVSKQGYVQNQANPQSIQASLSKEAIYENQKEQQKTAEQNQQNDFTPQQEDPAQKLAQIEQRLAKLESERQAVIAQLSSRDLEVRQHEEAHVRVGQELAGTPSYETTNGPDGKKYIINGEVPIDVSTSKDPEETMRRMQKVMRAALAPAQPSAADHQVYSIAQANYNEARAIKTQLDSKIDKENYEKAKIVARDKIKNQEEISAKNKELASMAVEEATEDLKPEKKSFGFAKKRNQVVAVLQKLELFGKKNVSPQETISNYFNWSSSLKLPNSYNAGANLDIAA